MRCIQWDRDKGMHYYERHEAVYRRRLAAGRSGWDAGAWEAYAMRPLIERWLAATGMQPCEVLEIGCGTGAMSCHLASLGFRPLGIDVAPSAVAAAREHAGRLGLDARFEVADACAWCPPKGAFRLVIDAHALHCVVYPAERRRFLAGVRWALAPGGEFWLETMTRARDGRVPAWAAQVDPQGIVWVSADSPALRQAPQASGEAVGVPSRYLASHADAVQDELRRAGLAPVHAEWEDPVRPEDAADFRARCRRARVGRTMIP